MTLFHESPASGILVLGSRVALSAEEGVEKNVLIIIDKGHERLGACIPFLDRITGL